MNSKDMKGLTIALAGNANVGKSAIFNQLTGLVQETGNWPGKTVELREGTLIHHGLKIKIVDLPGIYSFATYSPEELVTREYILSHHPDAVINVLDATSLERSLFFTLQLKEMAVPTVIALNLIDLAYKKHVEIDAGKLGNALGSPVIKTIAVQGIGVHELVDAALDLVSLKNPRSVEIKYGFEVEKRIDELTDALKYEPVDLPRRWLAVRLLEADQQAVSYVEPTIKELAQRLSGELSAIHKEDPATVITSEMYTLAARIAGDVSFHITEKKRTLINRLDELSLHPVAGYFILFLTMLAMLAFISLFGGWLTNIITNLFEKFNPHLSGPLGEIFWNGGITGLYASLSVALGFILPFYLILGILSETGYLPRIAFLMDRPCHLIGLHGQASMPLMLALGCNVPACLACRIMENRRDRILATFLSTMVPCSARTSVVLGMVGAFIGLQWAVLLLAFQFILVFIIGRILNRLNPSTSPGIIMEIPDYRVPSWRTVWAQSWNRFKSFVTIGVPLIVAGSMVIQSLQAFGWINHVTDALSPITVFWLGLPAFTGILLIFGILRKEASLALLLALAGGAPMTSIMTPLQMIVFSLVMMLYIPCISTIAVLFKETGFKLTALMVVSEIAIALIVGGIAFRLLGLFL
jgi:ferrous iron transport protein B